MRPYSAPFNRITVSRSTLSTDPISASGDTSTPSFRSFAWDVPLVTKDDACTFLASAANGGARNFDEVSSHGIGREFDRLKPSALLITGYGKRFHAHAFWSARRRGIPVLFRAETTDHAAVRNRPKELARDVVL